MAKSRKQSRSTSTTGEQSANQAAAAEAERVSAEKAAAAEAERLAAEQAAAAEAERVAAEEAAAAEAERVAAEQAAAAEAERVAAEQAAAAEAERVAAEQAAAGAEAAGEEVSLQEQLAELELIVDQDGLVSLEMMTGLCGPETHLVRGDGYRCEPPEAVRLARAAFARQGKAAA